MIKAPFNGACIPSHTHRHIICGRMREMPILVKIFISTHFRFEKGTKLFIAFYFRIFIAFLFAKNFSGDSPFTGSKRLPFRCTGGIPFHPAWNCMGKPVVKQIYAMSAQIKHHLKIPLSGVRTKVKHQAIFINELSFVQVSAVMIAKSAFKWI